MRWYQRDDYAEIASWYEARGERPPAPEVLSRSGLLEPGVAVGFLYATDSAMALLDGFATNPAAPIRARHAALVMIAQELAEEAEARGFRVTVGLTRSTGIARLARRCRFGEIGRYVMMTRET